MSAQYRAEIDGLRCFAVLPVVFFHAGLPLFQGGYVGVDVFFVISGYLITSMILNDIDQETFSLTSFYERRARRILPALYFVAFSCVLAGWFVLTPYYYRDLLQTSFATSIFSSNILLYIKSGYFSSISELKPLLHTWSLAVEEQFYLLFPLLLLLFKRLALSLLFAVLSLIAIASLAAAEALLLRDGQAVFYLLPFRAWELIAGALVALGIRDSGSHSNDLLSVLGFAAVILSMFFYDESSGVPGLSGLIPVAGTCLILLFAGPGTVLNRFLNFRLFVFIGLISYSLYLWHQPIFAFFRHSSFDPLGPEKVTLCLLIIFVLSFFSWKFVEAPFRDKSLVSARQMFTFSFLVTVCLGAVGLTGHMKLGFPTRLSEETQVISRGSFDKNPLQDQCHYRSKFVSLGDACVLGEQGVPTIALVGDSHADALFYELSNSLLKNGYSGISFALNGCSLVSFVGNTSAQQNGQCGDEVLSYIASQKNIQTVIVSNRWTRLVTGVGYGDELHESKSQPLQDRVMRGRASAFAEKISDLLSAGKKVVIVYPIPEAGKDVPNYIVKKRLLSDPEFILDFPREDYLSRNKLIIEAFNALGEKENLVRVQPADFFCKKNGGETCTTVIEGRSLYYDDDHLSNYGASMLLSGLFNEPIRQGQSSDKIVN